jgi:hypothetical protein
MALGKAIARFHVLVLRLRIELSLILTRFLILHQWQIPYLFLYVEKNTSNLEKNKVEIEMEIGIIERWHCVL